MSRHSEGERHGDIGPRTTPTFVSPSPRSHPSPGRAIRSLVPLANLILLVACGVQGPPQPPHLEKPEKVTDLSVAQIGRIFELRFTPPLRTVAGERLTKPLELQIFRSIIPPGEKTPDAPGSLRLWATLLATDLARYSEGQGMLYSGSLSEQDFRQWRGETFIFALRSVTRGFLRHPVESEFSNTVEATLLDVPGPMENFYVVTTEKALELHWSAPSRSLSGLPVSNLSGYRVFKSLTGKPGSFQLRGEIKLAVYRDPDFAFGHTYFYKVRAFLKSDDQVAESEDTAPLTITPKDTFPPAAPTGLNGIYTAAGVELIWTANSEPDLAGYNVYRREEEGPSRRINPELQRTPIFRDASVAPGHKYFYQVTAVDLSQNESARSEELLIETQ